MSTNRTNETRIVGNLATADGKGVVHVEDRFHTDIEDLWSAITDPRRLARWWGRVDGDLHVGGQFSLSTAWDGTGRIEACEAPHRLKVTIRESDESYRQGNGVPPFDSSIEATLSADGEQTILVVQVRGMPVEKIAWYGAGWQIHLENLARHLAGDERSDAKERWDVLVPPYQQLADSLTRSSR